MSLNKFDLIGRRVIAWPLIVIGLGLAYLSQWLITVAAWLTDNEDLLSESDSG